MVKDDSGDERDGADLFSTFLVKQQNKALTSAKREKDRKIAELTHALRELERQNKASLGKVSCMDRHWRQLEADIRRFCDEMDKENPSASAQNVGALVKPEGREREDGLSLLQRVLFNGPTDRRLFKDLSRYCNAVISWSREDGYVPKADLAELLHSFNPDPDDEDADDMDEDEEGQIEAAVKQRCLATRTAVQALVRRVEERQQRKTAGDNGEACAAADAAPSLGSILEENKRLSSDVELLKDRLDLESKEKMELMKQFLTALHVKQRLERAIDWKGWNPVPEKEGEEQEKKAEADACDKKCKAHEETNGSSSPGGKAGCKRRRTGEEEKKLKMTEEELAERRVDEKYFETLAANRKRELESEIEARRKLEEKLTELSVPRDMLTDDQLRSHPAYRSLENLLYKARDEREEAEGQAKALKREVEDLKAQLELVSAQRNEAVEQERTFWMERFQAATQELQALQVAHEESSLQAKNGALLEREVERLRHVNQDLTTEVRSKTAQCLSYRQRVEEADAAKKTIAEKMQRLEKEHDGQVKRRIEEAGGNADALRVVRIEELERQLQDAKETQESGAEMQAQLLEEMTAACEAQEAACREVEEFKTKLEETQQRMLSLQQELLRCQASEKVHFDKAAALERKVIAAEALHRQQEEYLALLQQQVQRAEENTRKAAQAQQAGESRLYEVQRAMEELQTELERVKRQLTQQQGRTEALQKRCDELAEETRKHKERMDDAVELSTRTKGQLEKLQGKLKKSKSVDKPGEAETPGETIYDVLNCSVCNTRWKNAIISKCFHMFCRECLDQNLKLRQRKCPACAKGFGEADVHDVFLT